MPSTGFSVFQCLPLHSTFHTATSLPFPKHSYSHVTALLPNLPTPPIFETLSSLPSPFLSLFSFPLFFALFNFWFSSSKTFDIEPQYMQPKLKCIHLCLFGLVHIQETSGTYACHNWAQCRQSSTHRFHRHLVHCCKLHAHSCTLQAENGDFFHYLIPTSKDSGRIMFREYFPRLCMMRWG